MSRKPETTFIASVHRHLPAKIYRMKNHNMYTGGVADCWYSGKKVDLWVEYKFLGRIPPIINLVDKPSPKVEPIISKLQQEWLEERFNEGRKVAVIVGWKDGGVVYRNLEWKVAIPRGDFLDKTRDRKLIAAFIEAGKV